MNRPVLMLVMAALLWSTGGLLIKSIEWNALGIAGARSAIAALTVYVLMPRVVWKFSAVQLGGALAYAGTMVLFVIANKLTTAANAIFLQYTAPIYIALFGAWFLGERATRLDWALILAGQLGIALFFFDKFSYHSFWGNLCALGSGISFASLVLLLRKQKDASPAVSVLLGNVLTALVCLPFAFEAAPGMKSQIGLVVLGVFQLGIPYALYARAIQKVKALEACLISLVEPVLNPLWVVLFLGEQPAPWALAGGGLVLLAAATRGVLTARRTC